MCSNHTTYRDQTIVPLADRPFRRGAGQLPLLLPLDELAEQQLAAADPLGDKAERL